MIAVDSSTFIAYLEGNNGDDVEFLDRLLKDKQVVLPPIVLTELLSDSSLDKDIVELIRTLPLLDISDGFWERAGKTRAIVLYKNYRAKLADTLIAQICIDHKVGLLTRDSDFKPFSRLCNLKLIE